MTEVVCPLCHTIWFLEDTEWNYTLDTYEKADCGDATFFCHECNRNIIFDSRGSRPVKTYASNTESFKQSWTY